MSLTVKPKLQRNQSVRGNSARRIVPLLVTISLVLLACNFPIKKIPSFTGNYPTLDPAVFEQSSTPLSTGTEPTPGIPPVDHEPPEVDNAVYHVYAAQSGDTLEAVARHFGVSPAEISSPAVIPPLGILPPGQYLVIPRTPVNQQAMEFVLPDSAVINSPCAADFDLYGYIESTEGYLREHTQKIQNTPVNGADVIQRVAENTSVNPRLLLAIVEYRAQWVLQHPLHLNTTNPLGLYTENYTGLYLELALAARKVNTGYYAWRSGELTELIFTDGRTIRLAPDMNAGSVGVLYLFSELYPLRELEERVYGEGGFIELYTSMFGDPMFCAREVEPLLTDQVTAPILELPFAFEETWTLSGGLHYDWNAGTPLGALDFAPNTVQSRCEMSPAWVLASAPGVITRADNSIVIISLVDQDKQFTGWEILYMHIAKEGMVPLGSTVLQDDPIGHPSCEGGTSSGTHVHIARKYRGEWISGGEPFPLILSGWTAYPGNVEYGGTLERNGMVVYAIPSAKSRTLTHIFR